MPKIGSVILRAPRDLPYKTVCVYAVESDQRLSFKACGLLLYLISRPEGWLLIRSDLIKRHADGKDSVDAGLKELKETGYLRILGPRSLQGQFSPGIWVVSETPLKSEKAWQELLKKMKLDNPENLKLL